jgi:D-lactate dehydrogenase (cytochrome)
VATSGGLVMSMMALREAKPPPQGQGDFERLEAEHYGQQYAIYLDRARLEALVPAGMSLELLDKMLPPELYYPPDPTEATATLGGTIATNASGARTFHYGATRDWVLGLEIVLPTGEPLTLNRGEVTERDGFLRFGDHAIPVPQYHMPELKNAAGLYAKPGMDLVDLFVGCEAFWGWSRRRG